MGYIDGKLRDGEQVVFRTKLHAAVLMFPILALAVAVAVFGFGGIGLLVMLLAAGWLAVGDLLGELAVRTVDRRTHRHALLATVLGISHLRRPGAPPAATPEHARPAPPGL